MVNMDKIIEQAIEKDASDIHLMSGLKPMFRITRALVEAENTEILKDEDMYEIYDYIVKDNNGKDVKLSKYKGKVLLIVNTATTCGFTKQYPALQELYKKYKKDINKN